MTTPLREPVITDRTTIGELETLIGEWAAETFEHTEETIALHIAEKAVKLFGSVLAIRNRFPESDVAGLLILGVSLVYHRRIMGTGSSNTSIAQWLDAEHDRNTDPTTRWELDETGLRHRVEPEVVPGWGQPTPEEIERRRLDAEALRT